MKKDIAKTETVELGKCSFRMPPVERVFGTREIYRIDCACNTTCLGNTEEEVKRCWKNHIMRTQKNQ